VGGKPKAAFTVKAEIFKLGPITPVFGMSGSLGFSWKYCSGAEEAEWSLLILNISGKLGGRIESNILQNVPGIESAFVEGGVYASLKADLLKGWDSREYSTGMYAQASLRVDVGFWDFEQIWGWSTGEFDFF
jgi:hypothetical protein